MRREQIEHGIDQADPTALSRRGFLRASALGIGMAACGGLATACSSGSSSSGSGINALYYYPAGGAGDRAFRRVAADYATKSKHKISFQLAPVATYNSALTSALRADTLPDLVWMQGGTQNAPVWSAMKALTKESAGASFADLTGWESVEIFPGDPGRYFGTPIGTQGHFWYYNKSVYTKAGLDPSKPPTTWAELAANCEKIKAAGIAPMGMAGSDGFSALFLLEGLTAQYFTEVETRDFYTGKRKFTDPTYGAMLRQGQSTSQWWNTDYKSKNSSDMTADFVAGKIGHVSGIVRGILDWGTFDTTKLKGGYGVFPTPVISGAPHAGLQASVAADAVLGVNRKSGKQSSVRDAIEFLSSATSQKTLLDVAGLMPNRKDVDIEAATTSEGARAIFGYLKSLPHSTAAAYIGGPSAAFAVELGQLTDVFAGGDVGKFQDKLTQVQAHATGS